MRQGRGWTAKQKPDDTLGAFSSHPPGRRAQIRVNLERARGQINTPKASVAGMVGGGEC